AAVEAVAGVDRPVAARLAGRDAVPGGAVGGRGRAGGGDAGHGGQARGRSHGGHAERAGAGGHGGAVLHGVPHGEQGSGGSAGRESRPDGDDVRRPPEGGAITYREVSSRYWQTAACQTVPR